MISPAWSWLQPCTGSVDSVTPQVVELVNLEVRLPRLWEITIALRDTGVAGPPDRPGHRGPVAAGSALWVDATIAPFVTRLAPGRLLKFVDALVVQADPAAAEARWTARQLDQGRDRGDGPRRAA